MPAIACLAAAFVLTSCGFGLAYWLRRLTSFGTPTPHMVAVAYMAIGCWVIAAGLLLAAGWVALT